MAWCLISFVVCTLIKSQVHLPIIRETRTTGFFNMDYLDSYKYEELI